MQTNLLLYSKTAPCYNNPKPSQKIQLFSAPMRRSYQKRSTITMELTLETGRPSDTTGRLEKEIRVYDFLDSLNIPYQRVDHEALMTIEACKDVDKILDAVICKNLFLCNRQETTSTFSFFPETKNSRPRKFPPSLA